MGDEIVFKSEAEMPPLPMSVGTTLVNKTGSWRYIRPLYVNSTPPCSSGCPAGEHIAQQLGLVKLGEYQKAWEMLTRENPFPGVCGRVCPHPCESECNRAELGGAIAIHSVERFLADLAAKEGWALPHPAPDRPQKVAVIGGGPAGLSCAYQLRLLGYSVTIFEASNALGGMMRLIPEYRLPRAVLEREIAAIRTLGMEVQTNQCFGQDISWSDLAEYGAIFIAVGQSQSRSLNIPGESEARSGGGLLSGIDFLGRIERGESVRIGPKVAVIGGGNTAMDAARSARRLGCEVTVLYRRSRREMPAIEEEIQEALEEGVRIEYLITPIEVLLQSGENNPRVTGLRCIRMRLGEPDETGRRKPIAIRGSEYEIAVDTVIPALGQVADLHYLIEQNAPIEGEILHKKGRIIVNKGCQTSVAKIFAGGDLATGAGSVVEAVGSGKRAALAIHAYLTHASFDDLPALGQTVHAISDHASPTVIRFADLNLAYFEPREAPPAHKLPVAERIGNFREVNLGLDEATVRREGERCFSCGVCNHCDTCLVFCPDVAILHTDDGDYQINYDYCKGCGICAEECPRRAIVIEEEIRWRK